MNKKQLSNVGVCFALKARRYKMEMAMVNRPRVMNSKNKLHLFY